MTDPIVSKLDRTPYCPNCGESCLDQWHAITTPDRVGVLEEALRDIIAECERDCPGNASDIAQAALNGSGEKGV